MWLAFGCDSSKRTTLDERERGRAIALNGHRGHSMCKKVISLVNGERCPFDGPQFPGTTVHPFDLSRGPMTNLFSLRHGVQSMVTGYPGHLKS